MRRRSTEASCTRVSRRVGRELAALPMAGEFAVAVAGPPQVVKVRRELLAACMTCPLCHKLLRDATTIPECLHTFCRKCIYEKLNDEETYCCPVCDIDLGAVPVEKLRADHNLQDIREKIFPSKRSKVEALEEAIPMIVPVKRKEKSLSSLVVNTPHVEAQTSLTGRRTKAVSRRAAMLQGVNPVGESTKREDSEVDNHVNKSISLEKKIKANFKRKMAHSYAEPSSHTANESQETGSSSFKDKVDIWKPLNCLVEAANRTKSFSSIPQSPAVKEEQVNGSGIEVKSNVIKVNTYPHKSEVLEQKSKNISMPPAMSKTSRLQRVKQRRKEFTTSAQTPLDDGNSQSQNFRMNSPIWFSLVPSLEQRGDPLPQLSANYLRIKDGSMLVSYIQKYLVRKLNLENEATFLESPAWTSWRAVRDGIRSTTFLSSFVGVFQGVICLHRKVASKDHKLIYWCAGAIAALSVLLEKKARRAELALYVLPRAVDSLWYISVNRHFLPDIKNAEVALFCICMGGIMFYLEQEPDTMAPFLRGLIRRFLASRISNPTPSANMNPSYSYLPNLGTIEKPESQMRKTGEEKGEAAASAKYNLDSIPGL